MPDVSSNDSGCPNCGAPGRRSMVTPFGSIRAREGVRFRCGRTEPEEGLGSSSCDYAAALRAQLAEAQEANRMLTARCDELAGLAESAEWVAKYVRGDNDEYFPGASDALKAILGGHCWTTLLTRVDRHRDRQATRCSDEDCRAPLRDGKTNHAVGCRAEQDGVTG